MNRSAEQGGFGVVGDDTKALQSLALAADAAIKANDALMLPQSDLSCLVLAPIANYFCQNCALIVFEDDTTNFQGLLGT